MRSPGLEHHAAGFSIVELMVAMTLSLVLLAGALSILYSTKLTSSENDRTARIQEAHIFIGHSLCALVEEGLGLADANTP